VSDELDGAALWNLNHRLLTTVLDACVDELAELGLEPKEFFVLAEIETSPYPAELADVLVIPRASVTSYLRALDARGLIERHIDPADLRRHRLTLTAKGVRTRDAARALLGAAFDARFARVSAHDRAELARIVTAVLAEGAP
jgi:DNA-binding MarR family transcriptional regulator